MKPGLLFLASLLMVTALGWGGPPPANLTWVYLAPGPARQFVSLGTALAWRQGALLDPQTPATAQFVVTGSESGAHPGTARLAPDGRTLLFYPAQPFAYAETVSVTLTSAHTAQGQPIAAGHYTFTTRAFRPLPPNDEAAHPIPHTPQVMPHYHTYPEFANVMPVTVTTPASGTAPGYVFLAGLGVFADYDPALLMLDDTGEPVYIQNYPLTAPRQWLADFKKQTVGGHDYLVYHQGTRPGANGWSNGRGYVLDETYTVVDTWNIGNAYADYGADLHDLQLLDNGHALLLSYVPVPYDLRPYGGPLTGTVVDIIVQEQDPQKNVVLEWSGLAHIPLTDSYLALSMTTPVDYLHTNSVALDFDGQILLSNRNTWDVTKIDRVTGAILWRLGGPANEFSFNGDPGFTFQHDARRLPNGNLTLFDNGNAHAPPASRQVEYQIDEINKVVTPTWQFPAAASRFSAIMGNAQRLSNGNTIGSWAGHNLVTEVRPDGTVAWEMALSAPTYRAFRYPWVGTPAAPPRLAAVFAGAVTTTTLYLAWNGATDLTGYDVAAGATLTSATWLTTTARTGFETCLDLLALPPETCVFFMRPRRAAGPALPLSNVVYRLDQPACRAQLQFSYLPWLTK